MNIKAILVVDIPDDWNCKEWCVEGELRGKNEDGYWIFCNEIVEAPLKPIPKKKHINLGEDYDAYYKMGWNECIEEIENG